MKELRETIHNATLTKTQKLIAKYVLDNSADACFMTSTDIADTLGVSESSVVRFSRSLGYSGFMEFQKSLRKDYQDKVLSISSSITVPSQRVAKQAKLETNSDYIKRHYKNTTKNLDTIFRRMQLLLLMKLQILLSTADTNISLHPAAMHVWAIIFFCT